MNKQLFGLFLILYGCFKLVVSVSNEIAPENIRTYLQHLPYLGGVFSDNDASVARHIFNLCFFLYGIDSLMHGLYLNRIGITSQPWILSHEGSYVVHFVLGLFMFILFYGLIDVNESFYVVEGIYTGLILLAIVPIMYLYNMMHDSVVKQTSVFLTITSFASLGLVLYVGRSIMLKRPDRVPNIIDMVGMTLNSL